MVVRILVAGIVGAIVSFLLGYVVWGIALAGYFASTLSPTGKTIIAAQPRMMPLIAAQIGFGLFFAFVLEKWAGARTLASGAFAGAVLGFSFSAVNDLMTDAFVQGLHVGANTPPMLVDIAAATVVGAVIGAVVALVLGMMSKGSSTSAEA